MPAAPACAPPGGGSSLRPATTGEGFGPMLPSQRALFDLPREVCYLNAAGWSPLPFAVQEAGRAGVARKGRPWEFGPDFANAHVTGRYADRSPYDERIVVSKRDDRWYLGIPGPAPVRTPPS